MTGKSEFYLKTQTYEDFITTMYIRADSFICNSMLYDTKWIKRNSISCIYIYTYMFGSKRTIISTNLLRAFYYKNFFVNSISGLNLEQRRLE